MALNIRRLTADDYDSILALWQQSGLPSLRPQGRDSREAFARQLARGQVVLGLADEAGRLIGCVVATHDTRKGWINRLVVDPEYRRKGHARQLIRAAEDALREQGMTLIAAQIEDGNTASLALFESEGYRAHRDVVYVSKRESDEA